MKLFYILFFISSVVFSQEIDIPQNIVTSYNDEQNIYLFSQNEYYTIDLLNYEISKLNSFENNGFNIKDFSPIKTDSGFYFVNNIGGSVLKLNENTLDRIDNSFNHKMQISSSVFKYNNEIYRYGGYGFFSARNFIVKYDHSTNEWESLILNNSDVPKARFDNSFLLNENDFIIIGGVSVDPLDRKNRIILNDSWQFSFKTMSWDKIASDEYFKYFSSKFFKIESRTGIIKDNKAYIYSNEDLNFNIHNIHPIFLKIDRRYEIYFFNNLFHFIVTRNNKMVLMSRTEEELLGPSINLKNISENIILNVLLTFIIFSIVSLLILLIYQYLHYVKLSAGKLKFKNIKINLSEEEEIILQEFISSQHILENTKVQELLDKEHYDRSNNIRRKNKLILELNSKLQYLFDNNITNYIQIQQSSYDKRYKRYFLYLENKKIIKKHKSYYIRFIYLLLLSIIFIVLWIN